MGETLGRRAGSLAGLLVASLFLLPGCWSNATADSSDVNEDKIYGDYDAWFEADTNEVWLHAQFTFGGWNGTTLRLSPPSTITVDGKEMDIRDGDEALLNLVGTYYTLRESTTEPSDSYTFEWTRTDSTTYTNVITMPKAVSIAAPLSGASHSMTDALEVEFAGDSLAGNDELECVLDGVKTVEIQTTDFGTGCVFTPDELQELGEGSVTATVERRLAEDPQQGHDAEGGKLEGRYKSKSVTFDLTK